MTRFAVYRENPLFRASQKCHHLQDLPRDPENFPGAHIPVDSNEVVSPHRDGRQPEL